MICLNLKAKLQVKTSDIWHHNSIQRTMKIYLDFDGTVVEHTYPQIGRYNAGCLEVLKKLQEAGHEIILNTMRVEFNNGTLEKAIDWFSTAHTFLLDKSETPKATFDVKLEGHTQTKLSPSNWDWQLHNETSCIYIDDICQGIPLKRAIESNGLMVDWVRLDIEFQENGIY